MCARSRPAWLVLAAALAAMGGAASVVAEAREGAPPRSVTALGRLQPKDGILRIAGPSQPSVVIAELLVEKGDEVEAGQPVAILDTLEILDARVARLEAQLAHARAELARNVELHEGRVISDSQRDSWELEVNVTRAELDSARAERERARVRSPVAGRVIMIHAHPGERVGADGILEIGRTSEMYAVAEVYETDIGRVKVGQRAVATSPALARPLEGTVEWITPKVGKIDVLGTDPAAKTDARVVEVEIKLDDSQRASQLTNLQVEIEIAP